MIQPLSFYDTYQKKQVTISENDTTHPGQLKIYRCGPTVYLYQHAGNLVGTLLNQILADTARASGWNVQSMENITDVGHLVGDGDHGEDKLELGAKREQKTVDEIVSKYFNNYKEQLALINIDVPKGKLNPKATEYIEEQLYLTLALVSQGKAYLEKDGVYFDSQVNHPIVDTINKLPGMPHGDGDRDFTGRDITSTQKHPQDFALWKFVVPETLQKWRLSDFPELLKHAEQTLHLPKDTIESLNLWGTPGWHSECVTMISQILGNQRFSLSRTMEEKEERYEIDIHIGGEDHIPVHHRNEILQSEACGFHLSKHWLHNKFLMVDGKKMSKSLGNIFTIHGTPEETGYESIVNKGFSPLSYRLLLMEHHYRDQINFTWEKLQQSQNRLYNIRKKTALLQSLHTIDDSHMESLDDQQISVFNDLLTLLREDLKTPQFLEAFDTLLDKTQQDQTLLPVVYKIEKDILRLDLFPNIPSHIVELAEKRQQSKQVKDYQTADTIRNDIDQNGWMIDDHSHGFALRLK